MIDLEFIFDNIVFLIAALITVFLLFSHPAPQPEKQSKQIELIKEPMLYYDERLREMLAKKNNWNTKDMQQENLTVYLKHFTN